MDQYKKTAGHRGISDTSVFLSGYTLNKGDRGGKFSEKDNEFCFEHTEFKGII